MAYNLVNTDVITTYGTYQRNKAVELVVDRPFESGSRISVEFIGPQFWEVSLSSDPYYNESTPVSGNNTYILFLLNFSRDSTTELQQYLFDHGLPFSSESVPESEVNILENGRPIITYYIKKYQYSNGKFNWYFSANNNATPPLLTVDVYYDDNDPMFVYKVTPVLFRVLDCPDTGMVRVRLANPYANPNSLNARIVECTTETSSGYVHETWETVTSGVGYIEYNVMKTVPGPLGVLVSGDEVISFSAFPPPIEPPTEPIVMTDIGAGQTITFEITSASEASTLRPGCYCRRFVLKWRPQDGPVARVLLRSSQLDAYLFMIDGSQTPRMSDDDSGGGRDSKLEFLVGNYAAPLILEATTYREHVFAELSISVIAVEPLVIPEPQPEPGMNTVSLNGPRFNLASGSTGGASSTTVTRVLLNTTVEPNEQGFPRGRIWLIDKVGDGWGLDYSVYAYSDAELMQELNGNYVDGWYCDNAPEFYLVITAYDTTHETVFAGRIVDNATAQEFWNGGSGGVVPPMAGAFTFTIDGQQPIVTAGGGTFGPATGTFTGDIWSNQLGRQGAAGPARCGSDGSCAYLRTGNGAGHYIVSVFNLPVSNINVIPPNLDPDFEISRRMPWMDFVDAQPNMEAFINASVCMIWGGEYGARYLPRHPWGYLGNDGQPLDENFDSPSLLGALVGVEMADGSIRFYTVMDFDDNQRYYLMKQGIHVPYIAYAAQDGFNSERDAPKYDLSPW